MLCVLYFHVIDSSIPAAPLSHPPCALQIEEQDRIKPVGSGCIAQVYRGLVYVPGGAGAGMLPESAAVKQAGPSDADAKVSKGDLEHRLMPTFTPDHVPDFEGGMTPPPTTIARSLPNPNVRENVREVEVALKILHPHARWAIQKDIKLLTALATLAEHIPFVQLHWVSPVEMMAEFSRLMLTQLNLTMEADNLVQFSKNFAEDMQTRYAHFFPSLFLLITMITHRYTRFLPYLFLFL